jgi:Serine/threonine protein kinase
MKEQNGFISERKQSSNDEQPGLLSFGNYDLVRRIDVGGMGEVYLARQRTAFGREVAVKIIRPDLVNDAVARQRFLREAEVGSYLKHDHILPLLEFGEEQGRLFIVTPYIAGGTLAQRIERGPLSLVEIRELFSALLRAVSYLHKRGIVHRDLKPGNILLDKEEDSEHVYVRLIDFGIATAQGLPPSAALTAADGEVGTAAYMAPERRRGVAAPSNDIYSLGVILYLMLTGALPEHAEDLQALPPALSSVITHCLAPDPAQRFTSADELARAFEYACRSVSSSQLPTVGERALSSPPSPLADERSGSAEAARSGSADAMRGPTTRSSAQERVLTDPGVPPLQSRPTVSGSSPSLSLRSSTPVPPTPSSLAASSGRQTQEQVVISPLERLNRRRSSGEYTAVEAMDNSANAASPLEKEYVVLERRNSTNPQQSTPSQLPPQAGTVLPPLTKQRKFRRDDYDAPTSMIDLEAGDVAEDGDDVQMHKRTLRNSVPFLRTRAQAGAGGLTTRGAQATTSSTKNRRARRGSLGLLITIATILVVLALVGVTYLVYISSMVATVTVGPRMQTVSEVLTMTASPNVKSVNASKKLLPASALTVNQSGSLQGAPTGVSGCVLGIFECKQTVSLNDISNLAAQLRPGLKNTIAQNINKQASAQGVMTIGDIVYTDGDVTASPPQGTVSRSVTVTLAEQGSIEYIRTSDARTLAMQLLKQKTPTQYSLIDTMTQVGQPVIRGVAANGDVQLAIAAAGVARYQLSDDELVAIQKHIEGMSLKAAQAYIVTLPNLDPSIASVRLNYGDSIPGNTRQIKITQLQPTNIPTAQLPKVPK